MVVFFFFWLKVPLTSNSPTYISPTISAYPQFKFMSDLKQLEVRRKQNIRIQSCYSPKLICNSPQKSKQNWNRRQMTGSNGATRRQWISGESLEGWCQQLYVHMVTNSHPLSTGEAPLISQSLARDVLLKACGCSTRKALLSSPGRQAAKRQRLQPLRLSLPEGTHSLFCSN